MKTPPVVTSLSVAAGLSVASLSAHSQVLIQHIGNNAPAGEGWQVRASGSVSAMGIDDGGVAAWSVDDDDTDGYRIYENVLTPEQFTDTETRGWRLTSTLRVVDGPEDGLGSTFFEFRRINFGYLLFFGQQADGDPVMVPWGAGPAVALDAISPGYHTYSMVFDPALQSVDIFVDGVERVSDYSGYAITGSERRVAWGAGASAFTGQGNFNFVEFAVVPEPEHAILSLCCGLGGLAAWHHLGIRSRRGRMPLT